MKFELIDYFDIWGNSEDGWDVNDSCILYRDIFLPEDFSDNEIIDTLINIGYFKINASVSNFEIVDLCGMIEINNASDGSPICALREAI